jgi:hypothetical protein
MTRIGEFIGTRQILLFLLGLSLIAIGLAGLAGIF